MAPSPNDLPSYEEIALQHLEHQHEENEDIPVASQRVLIQLSGLEVYRARLENRETELNARQAELDTQQTALAQYQRDLEAQTPSPYCVLCEQSKKINHCHASGHYACAKVRRISLVERAGERHARILGSIKVTTSILQAGLGIAAVVTACVAANSDPLKGCPSATEGLHLTLNGTTLNSADLYTAALGLVQKSRQFQDGYWMLAVPNPATLIVVGSFILLLLNYQNVLAAVDYSLEWYIARAQGRLEDPERVEQRGLLESLGSWIRTAMWLREMSSALVALAAVGWTYWTISTLANLPDKGCVIDTMGS